MRLLGPTLVTLRWPPCSRRWSRTPALRRQKTAGARSGRLGRPVPLKDAKLNIEHNATDKDTGFQGFIDSEGWRRLDVRGPNGRVLMFEASGALGRLGLTELFFETVEPENAEAPIEQILAKLPRATTIAGPAQENGRSAGPLRATPG